MRREHRLAKDTRWEKRTEKNRKAHDSEEETEQKKMRSGRRYTKSV